MKLIVGLGNPGKGYENTRHNTGFMFLDWFSESLNIKLDKKKFNGYYVKTKVDNEDLILLKPLSYMNLSGEVVERFVNYYNIDTKDILIISDDLDLEVGSYKLKAKGSSGGHNGLKNIELHLATQEYKRLKIGISNDKNVSKIDYVLGKFSNEEEEVLEKMKNIINNILKDFLYTDFDLLMSKYNNRNGMIKK